MAGVVKTAKLSARLANRYAPTHSAGRRGKLKDTVCGYEMGTDTL